MRARVPQPLLMLMLCLSASPALACVAGFGVAVGLQHDTDGHTAVMLRGWSRAGARMGGNDAPRTPRTHESGLFWLPQLEVGGGWDFSQHGPRVEVGMPFLGYARAPVPGRGGWAWSVQSSARLSVAWPHTGNATFHVGGAGAFMAQRVLGYTDKGVYAPRPEWEPARLYETLGVRIEGVGQGGPQGFLGSLFAGPAFEHLVFYPMGL